jgi:2-octaprenyl-6-methoxyphenol hydroxylase
MTTDYAIAICGAGPVGLTLATLLARHGIAPNRIALFDARPLAHSAQDPRAIALAYGSRQCLEQADAWPLAATAITQIHVSRRGHFGRALLDCSEYGVPALGYLVRYGTLVAKLSAAATAAGINPIRPAQVTATNEGPDEVMLHWQDGPTGAIQKSSTQIVVQAEGGVFQASGQPTKARHRDYQQTALIAHVKTTAPIPQRAFERFTDEGPLALLPQDDGYALVWCSRPATASALLALDDAAFLAELEQVFGSRLGRFCAVSARTAYPLGLNAEPAATARTVAIGNAAQILHPVAGQGMNLGLRDAMVLARLLAQDTSPAMLQRFLESRQRDRTLTISMTDMLARLFTGAPFQGTLSLGLGLLDVLKPAKRAMADLMMFGSR